jgi:hypothetical protein
MKAESQDNTARREPTAERLAMKRADIAKGRRKPSRDFSDVRHVLAQPLFR